LRISGTTSARWLALASVLFVLLRAVRVLYFYTGLLQTAGEDKDPESALSQHRR